MQIARFNGSLMTIDIRDYINGIEHANKNRDDIDKKIEIIIDVRNLI